MLGGSGAIEIYLGCFLGLLLGIIPGLNLTSAIIILLILILNVNLGATVLSFALGEILLYILAPVTYSLGYILIHSTMLNPLFVFLCNSPFTALLGLQNYCLTGGLVLGSVIGLVFAYIFSKIIFIIRKGMDLTGTSGILNKISKNFLARFIIRIVFGKAKYDDLKKRKNKIVRKGFLYPFTVIIILIAVFQYFFLPHMLENYLVGQLQELAGAEVNIGKFDCSIFGGDIKLRKLQITDAEKPGNNAVSIDTANCEFSVMSLLAGRTVIDLLALKGLRTDTKRKTPGKVFVSKRKTETVIETGSSDTESVNCILEKIKKGSRYLEKIQEYVKLSEEKKKTETEEEKVETPKLQKERYIEYLTLSAESLTADNPALLIKNIKADSKLPYPMEIEVENFSTDPDLVRQPLIVEVNPKKENTGPKIKMKLNTRGKYNRTGFLSLNIIDFNLGKFEISSQFPYKLKNAKADIEVSGKFTGKKIDLPMLVNIKNLELDKKASSKIAYLNTSSLKSIKSIPLYFNVTGTVDSLKILPDNGKNIESLKSVFKRQAKNVLSESIDDQLKENKNYIPKKVREKLKTKHTEKLKESILGVFN